MTKRSGRKAKTRRYRIHPARNREDLQKFPLRLDRRLRRRLPWTLQTRLPREHAPEPLQFLKLPVPLLLGFTEKVVPDVRRDGESGEVGSFLVESLEMGDAEVVGEKGKLAEVGEGAGEDGEGGGGEA